MNYFSSREVTQVKSIDEVIRENMIKSRKM